MRKNVFRRATAALIGAAAIAVMAPATSASAATDVADLRSGDKLLSGQSLKSGGSVLAMQPDGNLVMYLEGPTGARVSTAMWSTGTYGNPGAYAFMQPDGNLVVYKQGSTADADALWSTRTWSTPGGHLTLNWGGMTVWPARGGNAAWESRTGVARAVDLGGDHPESFINSARNVEGGQWIQSNSVWLVNQPDGNLVLYRKRDGAALWSSGTWNRGSSSLILSTSQGDPALRLKNGSTNTWSTPAKGASDLYGVVQDDANFVLYSNGSAVWATGTWNQG
ncbi:hypothetical protein [Kitasatospora sp. CB01950]|uniref:hypothetical protein n=1 Tax=Kitasatospora sp. CB01950 TaxID=1703930 RepID=UPI000939C469|nr:hypothetical protein [Kitasatospora sp. CB01950]